MCVCVCVCVSAWRVCRRATRAAASLSLRPSTPGLNKIDTPPPPTQNTHTHTHTKKRIGHYTIFGEVVSGHEVLDAVNALSVGRADNTAAREDAETALITDTGQVRRGAWVPVLELKTSLKEGLAR